MLISCEFIYILNKYEVIRTLRLSIPQMSNKVLFETILQPSNSVVAKLLKKKEIGEGEINIIFDQV